MQMIAPHCMIVSSSPSIKKLTNADTAGAALSKRPKVWVDSRSIASISSVYGNALDKTATNKPIHSSEGENMAGLPKKWETFSKSLSRVRLSRSVMHDALIHRRNERRRTLNVLSFDETITVCGRRACREKEQSTCQRADHQTFGFLHRGRLHCFVVHAEQRRICGAEWPGPCIAAKVTETPM